MIALRPAIIVTVVGLSFAHTGCSGRPSQGLLTPVADNVEGTSRVQILAATTRRRSTTNSGEMFSGERADEMSFAAVTVSIPPDTVRKVGEIQWPASPPGDPRRDFVTVAADYLDKPSFAGAIARLSKQTGRKKVLVFVHGFNNRFDDAVYRFAQIVHDSKSPAIPVLFTWPSRGEMQLRAYNYDRESASYSRDALEELLDILARHPAVAEVNILAHSMGNWVTLEALRARSLRPGRAADKVKYALLVAPDVDVDVFRTQIRRMGNARPRFALFVSQDDKALAVSQTLSGGVPRLGEVNPNEEPYRSEFERDRIEVFDLTKLESNHGNAHSRAFDEVTSVAMMVRERLRDGQR